MTTFALLLLMLIVILIAAEAFTNAPLSIWAKNSRFRKAPADIIITLLAALWMRVLAARGQLRVWHRTKNGLLYVIYLSIPLT